MDKWDRRFLDMARLVSGWSKDPSTKVGAVIVDDKNRVVSVGFNGFPRGVKDTFERYQNRETKYNLVIHAEVNALLFSQGRATGSTLYVYPLPPCVRCAVEIVQSGITVVKTIIPDSEAAERWKESTRLSEKVFKEGGVDLFYLPY